MSPGTEVGVDITESTVDFITHIACGGGERERHSHSCLEIDMFCPAQKDVPACMEYKDTTLIRCAIVPACLIRMELGIPKVPAIEKNNS